MLPSEALHPIFILAPTDIETAPNPVATLNSPANDISGYGIILGNLGLLLPTDTSSRLVDLNIRLCRLPIAPNWLLGIANLEGDLIPLFDLAKLLELPIEMPIERYVVIGAGEQAIGIGIIGHPQRVHLKATDKLHHNPPLPIILQPYIQSVYRTNYIWITYDHTAFFTAQGRRLAQDWFIEQT